MFDRLVAAGLACVAVGCSRRDKGEELVVTSSTCLRCDAPVRAGALSSRDLDEVSGLVASSRDDGVFFVHNDSGDSARFFAIDRTGKLLATYTYSRNAVVDCEEIARGPCDAPRDMESCLFVADVGDNLASRDHIVVYRVREPRAIADATVEAQAFSLKYPEGPRDAETLLVHPVTGVLTIATKVKSGPSTLYEAPSPLVPGPPAMLRKVGSLQIPVGSMQLTGGSVHPGGRGVLLRTYTHVYFAPMRPEQTVAQALGAPLCTLPAAREEQGESIGWLRGGDGYLTTSEGRGAPVSAVSCATPP